MNLYKHDEETIDGYYQPYSYKDLKISGTAKNIILSYDYNKDQVPYRTEDFTYDHVKFREAYRVKGEMILTKK